MAKLCFFDLECSGLRANFSYLLSFGWKFQGEKKANVISIADYPLYEKDPTNDKQLLKDARDILMESDIICGHYSSRFDLPYLNSRLLYHKMRTVPSNIPHIDTWKVARYKLALNSNRLDTIAKFLEVPHSKTPVSGPQWIRAQAGHKKSLKYVIDHNRADIYVLEEVYDRIRCLITNHPNVNIVTGNNPACPVCGGVKLQKRGWNIAGVSRSRRYHCRTCGAWSRGKPERVTGLEVR